MRALVAKLTNHQLTNDDSGVTAIEYGLIAALIAVVCIAVWTLIGTGLSNNFTSISNCL
jgi:pilus assembly protein Flp/PilA